MALCVTGCRDDTGTNFKADKIKFRLSFDAAETDQRSIALLEKFGPGIAHFADFEPHWNASLFRQGTELIALARGNLDMTITSAQDLAEYSPEFSIFSAGYVHRDAAHQVAVFNDPLMDPFKRKVEDELGVKLLSVMYLGRRQLNLRTDEKVMTPEDMAGVRAPTGASYFSRPPLACRSMPAAASYARLPLRRFRSMSENQPLRQHLGFR